MKKKTIAFVGIAVCVMLVTLLTSPVLASAGYSKIYGNANEDDVLDMRDVTYLKLVIFGKKPATTFADANYDGKVSMLDIGQTKLIILGKEKKLTVIDINDRTVTVSKPIEGVIVTHREQFEQLRSLKVPKDILLAAERQVLTIDEYKLFFVEYQDLPGVGSCHEPNLEVMVGLRPDAILMGSFGQNSQQHTAALEVFESAGIPVIYAHETETNFEENIRMLGYLFGKKDEAEEYIDWRKGLLNLIGERVDDIPEEDKPKVYIEWWQKYQTNNEASTRIAAMGGRDIFEGEVSGDINPEEVAKQNPDIIVITGGSGSGYITDDVTELKERREELMSREELQDVPAVKTGKVYVMSVYITGTGPYHGGRDFVQEAYLAKWFNPTYFDDFDPKAIHQEYLTRFQGLDWDLDKHGVYVYHPEEHPDGN